MARNGHNGNGNGNGHHETESGHLDARAFKVAKETLTGDIRDVMLSEIRRHADRPWGKLSEAEQQRVIDRAAHTAENLVLQAVQIIAAGGRKFLPAVLKKVALDNVIKAELHISRMDETRHDLYDHQGSGVLVVLTNAAPYRGERAPAFADKDEPEMFDEETGELLETEASTKKPGKPKPKGGGKGGGKSKGNGKGKENPESGLNPI